MLRRIALLVLVASLVSVPSAAARSSFASHDRLVGERRATPTCRGKVATIVGTPGNDDLDGTESRDVIVGLGGNDKITGHGGNDLICGNGGEDYIIGGGFFSDKTKHDVLLGGDDHDTVRGGGGDFLFGGDGPDSVGLPWHDQRGGIAHGGRGDDELGGSNGPDVLFGGPGSDRLWGGAGDDRLHGGSGADWVGFPRGCGVCPPDPDLSVTVDLAAGTSSGVKAGDDTLMSIENIRGSGPSDDVVTGDGGPNVIYAGRGNDTVAGGGGDDQLVGESGDDQLVGGGGTDSADGGRDTDTCVAESVVDCEA